MKSDLRPLIKQKTICPIFKRNEKKNLFPGIPFHNTVLASFGKKSKFYKVFKTWLTGKKQNKPYLHTQP